MNQQAYALTGLLFITACCCGALGFAFGRLTGRARGRSASESRSEALLATALEDGLAQLKARQKEISARAAASERLNSHIVEGLSAGLLLVDRDGTIELLNPAGRRLLGLGDVDTQPCATALATTPTLVAVIAQCLKSGAPIVRRTLPVVRPTGTMHLGVTVSRLDDTERSGGVICLFSDVTSVVEMEDQLRLKDALARLGELTAGLAHEFRNGLATIHGYGRLLDPAQMPVAYRPYVEGIRLETDQLGRIVTNFLMFARPEQLSFVQVQLSEVVRRSVEDVRREAPGVDIRVEGAFGCIDGDEQLLKQAFDNVIRNAAQSCVSAAPAPAVIVRGLPAGEPGVTRVCVDDNGPGIPEGDRLRVFQPFVTTRAAGTGLGLAMVQKIVLAHNGKVSVSASPERGARLDLTFPLTVAAGQAA